MLAFILGSIRGRLSISNQSSFRLSSSAALSVPPNSLQKKLSTKNWHWSPLGNVCVSSLGSLPNPKDCWPVMIKTQKSFKAYGRFYNCFLLSSVNSCIGSIFTVCISNQLAFLISCRLFSKIGTGFSDDDLKTLSAKLNEHIIPRKSSQYNVTEQLKCDVWFDR